jgi:hypothetical protein
MSASVDGRIILKQIFKKQHGVNGYSSGQEHGGKIRDIFD